MSTQEMKLKPFGYNNWLRVAVRTKACLLNQTHNHRLAGFPLISLKKGELQRSRAAFVFEQQWCKVGVEGCDFAQSAEQLF